MEVEKKGGESAIEGGIHHSLTTLALWQGRPWKNGRVQFTDPTSARGVGEAGRLAVACRHPSGLRAKMGTEAFLECWQEVSDRDILSKLDG